MNIAIPTSRVANERGPILATTRAHLITLESGGLSLWLAATEPETWLRAGRIRPLVTDAALRTAITEARLWLHDLGATRRGGDARLIAAAFPEGIDAAIGALQ